MITSVEPRNEPGWAGAFTRHQAEGAILNGARVAKINSEPGDAHQDGDEASVLGSVFTEAVGGYFIEWDDSPRTACFISRTRLREVT